MNAKEYLEQAYRLDQEINEKLEQLERHRALAQKVTASYAGECVSHTRNNTSLEDTVVRMIEAEEELNRDIDRLVDTKRDISKLIDQVRNDDYRLLLQKRYLNFHTWKQIAEEMSYGNRWLFAQHKKALAVIDKLLEERVVQ